MGAWHSAIWKVTMSVTKYIIAVTLNTDSISISYDIYMNNNNDAWIPCIRINYTKVIQYFPEYIIFCSPIFYSLWAVAI